jgi:4-hydroxybenzoate polyprenyltransferase
MKKIEKFVNKLLTRKISPVFWLINFLGIIFIRLFLDKFIARSSSPLFDFIMDIHNILFFLLTFLFIWLILSFILKKKPFELAYLMLWASLFIIFPPILDLIKTGGDVYWSFYLISSPTILLKQFLAFFGFLPSGIVYFGSKVTFILAIFLLSGLVFVKTKSVIKMIISALGTYVAFFAMASFPSIMAYLGIFLTKGYFLKIKEYEIIQFFTNANIWGVTLKNINYSLVYNLNFIYFLLVLAFLFLFFAWSEKVKFWSILRNFRYPQIIYNSGVFILGSLLGILAFSENFKPNLFSLLGFLVLLISVWLSWKASVVANDIYDIEIDKITNAQRPLPRNIFKIKEYKQLGIIIFFLAILGGFLISYKFGWLLISYQILAWFYSGQPFRLKRFPILGTFVSAWASLIIFMMGFILFSPGQNLNNFSWRFFFLLLFSYTFCLIIKDLKDIEGDRKFGIKTIPVILGEEKGRLFVGASFFTSYILSVFFLNEWKLFWWSIIFGSVSFFIINNQKVTSRRLLWWNLAIVFIYGLILVKIVFF